MEPTVRRESTRTFLDVDQQDPICKQLFGYAERVGTLLTAPADQVRPECAGCLDDYLGAIYGLILARHHKFRNRLDRPISIPPVAELTAQIARGRMRTNGQWIAGFYFNNALFRTAGVYHRIVIVAGKRGTASKGDTRMPVNLRKVCDEVNALKHQPKGVYQKRSVTYEEALQAAGELLRLIEGWATAAAG